jgi:hypothetical protein
MDMPPDSGGTRRYGYQSTREMIDVLKIVVIVAGTTILVLGFGLLAAQFIWPSRFEILGKRFAKYGINLRPDAPGYGLVLGGTGLLLTTLSFY